MASNPYEYMNEQRNLLAQPLNQAVTGQSLGKALSGDLRKSLEQAAYDLSQQDIPQASRDAELNRLKEQYGYQGDISAQNYGINAQQSLNNTSPQMAQYGPEQILGQAAYDLNQQQISPEARAAELNRLKGELGYSGDVNAQNFGINAGEAMNSFQNAPVAQQTQPGRFQDMQTAMGFGDVQNAQNKLHADMQVDYNRVNEEDPYGKSEYIRNPDGSFTRKTSLSGNQQTLLDQQEQQQIGRNQLVSNALGRAGANLSDPYTLDGAPDERRFSLDGLPDVAARGDLFGARERAESAIYDRYKRDIDRDYSERQRALEQNLANRGIPLGSEAWNKELERLNRSKDEALEQVRTSAIGEGRNEFGMLTDYDSRLRRDTIEERLTDAGESRTDRDRYIGEMDKVRNMPLVDIQNLGGYGQGPRGPNTSGISQIGVANTDVLGAGMGLVSDTSATDRLGIGNQHQADMLANQQAFTQNVQFPHERQMAAIAKGGGGGGGQSSGSSLDSYFYNQLSSVPTGRASGGMSPQGGGK